VKLVIVLLALTVSVATAANHDVLVQGLVFIPDDLTIEAGDSVTWTHDATSASHTITSGLNALDREVGALFDETFNQPGQTFVYTFAAAGDVPYFCRPHLGLGMTGIIRVTGEVAADQETWSGVKALWR